MTGNTPPVFGDDTPLQNKDAKEIVPSDATIIFDRITARLMLHYEHYGDNPTSIMTQFDQMLKTNNQQPWRRVIEVTPEKPADISKHWLDSPGTIVIENKVGSRSQIKLSAEAQAELDSKILYVYINGGEVPDTIVRPGRFVMFELLDPGTVKLESKSGGIPVVINILPE